MFFWLTDRIFFFFKSALKTETELEKLDSTVCLSSVVLLLLLLLLLSSAIGGKKCQETQFYGERTIKKTAPESRKRSLEEEKPKKKSVVEKGK